MALRCTGLDVARPDPLTSTNPLEGSRGRSFLAETCSAPVAQAHPSFLHACDAQALEGDDPLRVMRAPDIVVAPPAIREGFSNPPERNEKRLEVLSICGAVAPIRHLHKFTLEDAAFFQGLCLDKNSRCPKIRACRVGLEAKSAKIRVERDRHPGTNLRTRPSVFRSVGV
jgi:hypothetical protein